ncbi:hypothetical protein BGZ95_009132 [Linnemannia exigua]|uniref:Transmembrane protein n=1 Tax=Linnemannia exigua TaxID=604196 RepID=A0AAD4DDQ0_9FUNG|nr:hypothetical protein BGZ95_009132 [Linnemannia exigua]
MNAKQKARHRDRRQINTDPIKNDARVPTEECYVRGTFISCDSNHLKTIINIWAAVCSFAFTGLLYCLGRWITADLVWHLQPMDTVRLEAGWGLRPGLFSIWNGLKLKTHFGLLLGVALMAIWGVSNAMHAWLTECVDIETYTQIGVPQPFLISRLQSMADSDSSDWYTGYYSDVSGYGTQAMIGWENRTQLHYEDGEYFWSPVQPKCTQLTNLDVTTAVVQDTVNITVNNSTRTHLRGTVKWTITTELLQYYWATVLDGEDVLDGKTYNVTDRHTLFHIFGTGHASTPPTVKLANGYKPNIYIFMCTVGVKSWDIEATINPLKVDRLVLTRKTPVALRTDATIYVESAIMGLDSATKPLTNSETIMTPIQKWMSNTKNSASRLSWFDNITEGWLESKTAECIAFMTTPITLVGETQLTVGNELVSTFILQSKPIYIIAGVSFQVALIALVIGVYLAKADKGKFYGDSIVSLISRCGKDWELEPLKKRGTEESDHAEDV